MFSCLRTPFLKEHLRWLLLEYVIYVLTAWTNTFESENCNLLDHKNPKISEIPGIDNCMFGIVTHEDWNHGKGSGEEIWQ